MGFGARICKYYALLKESNLGGDHVFELSTREKHKQGLVDNTTFKALDSPLPQSVSYPNLVFDMSNMGRSGSFRLQGVDSLKVFGRCNSSILLSEAISDDCDRMATYERLSQSMRFNDFKLSPRHPRKKKQAWDYVSWVFSKLAYGGENEKIKEDATADSGKLGEKKKWRSSWLPDPDRRWPLQGW